VGNLLQLLIGQHIFVQLQVQLVPTLLHPRGERTTCWLAQESDRMAMPNLIVQYSVRTPRHQEQAAKWVAKGLQRCVETLTASRCSRWPNRTRLPCGVLDSCVVRDDRFAAVHCRLLVVTLLSLLVVSAAEGVANVRACASTCSHTNHLSVEFSRRWSHAEDRHARGRTGGALWNPAQQLERTAVNYQISG
jgi:hypothetical protein